MLNLATFSSRHLSVETEWAEVADGEFRILKLHLKIPTWRHFFGYLFTFAICQMEFRSFCVFLSFSQS